MCDLEVKESGVSEFVHHVTKHKRLYLPELPFSSGAYALSASALNSAHDVVRRRISERQIQ